MWSGAKLSHTATSGWKSRMVSNWKELTSSASTSGTESRSRISAIGTP